jgi:Cdc6-like AAA superfamily ATPase
MANEFGDLFGNVPLPRSEDDWNHLEYRAADIFSPHAPIDEEDLFAGRLALIDDLMETVLQRGQHGILYGERGVGKTSLTRVVQQKIFARSRRYKIFQRNCTADHTFRKIWEQLLDEIKYDDEFMFSDLVDNSTDAYHLHKWIQSMPENFHPVFIIDEYDRIKDSGTHIKMADTIKYFSDFSCKATIIIVGVSRDVKSLFGGHPSIERNIRQLPMPYMSKDELMQIIDKRLADLGMTVERHVENTLISLAQGLPGYTHLLGQNATRNAIRRRDLKISMDDLNAALDTSIRTCDEKIRELYAQAVRSTKPQNQYREALLACALAPIDERGFFAAADVKIPFNKIMGRDDLDIPHFSRHITQFCKDERGPALVQEGRPKSYQYRFSDALLRPYTAIKGINDRMVSMDMFT